MSLTLIIGIIIGVIAIVGILAYLFLRSGPLIK